MQTCLIKISSKSVLIERKRKRLSNLWVAQRKLHNLNSKHKPRRVLFLSFKTRYILIKLYSDTRQTQRDLNRLFCFPKGFHLSDY